MAKLAKPKHSWPLDYGDPLEEYSALTERWGFAPFPPSGALFLNGPHAGSFLADVLSNKRPTQNGKGNRSLVLAENGTICFDICTSQLDPEHFLLTGSGAVGAALQAHLLTMTNRQEIDIEMATLAWGRFGIGGPQAAEHLQSLLSLQQLPSTQGDVVKVDSGWLICTNRSGQQLWEWFFPLDQTAKIATKLRQLGADQIGCTAFGWLQLSQGQYFQRHIAGRYPSACGLEHLVSSPCEHTPETYLSRLVSTKEISEGTYTLVMINKDHSESKVVGEVLTSTQVPILKGRWLLIVSIEGSSRCKVRSLIDGEECIDVSPFKVPAQCIDRPTT